MDIYFCLSHYGRTLFVGSLCGWRIHHHRRLGRDGVVLEKTACGTCGCRTSLWLYDLSISNFAVVIIRRIVGPRYSLRCHQCHVYCASRDSILYCRQDSDPTKCISTWKWLTPHPLISERVLFFFLLFGPTRKCIVEIYLLWQQQDVHLPFLCRLKFVTVVFNFVAYKWWIVTSTPPRITPVRRSAQFDIVSSKFNDDIR